MEFEAERDAPASSTGLAQIGSTNLAQIGATVVPTNPITEFTYRPCPGDCVDAPMQTMNDWAAFVAFLNSFQNEKNFALWL